MEPIEGWQCTNYQRHRQIQTMTGLLAVVDDHTFTIKTSEGLELGRPVGAGSSAVPVHWVSP